MQTATGITRREPWRAAAQAILIIAVALAGAAFGRWIIPAGDGSSGGSIRAGNTSSASAAETIAERHFELRGAYSGTDPAGVAVIADDSSLSVPAKSSYDEAGDFATADPAGVAVITSESSVAAETIAQRKFESGRLEDVLFGDVAVLGASTGPGAISPAATIAQRKYDSGGLEEILFGTN